MNFKHWVILCIAATGTIFYCASGCIRTPGIDSPSVLKYSYKSDYRRSCLKFSGVVDAEKSETIALQDGAWGTIKWLADEGTLIASGDPLVSIDMEDGEREYEWTSEELEKRQSDLKIHEVEFPKKIEEADYALQKRNRELAEKEHEKELLFAGSPQGEIWRVETNRERSKCEYESAKMKYEHHEKVAAKGFDSPFSLRKKEIEVKEKSVELDYTERLLQKMANPPMPEEIARMDHLIEVASGEVWLAANQLNSASVTGEIEGKNLKFFVEHRQLNLKRQQEQLDQREIRAPMDGIVVYPSFWGGQKASVGMQVWDGFAFLKISATESLLLDAAVDESVSSLLKVGDPATITLEAYPSKALNGKVSFIGKSPKPPQRFRGVQSEFKKFPIQIKLSEIDFPIAIGMKGSVEVEIASGAGVFLPRDIVNISNGSASVRVESYTGIASMPVKVESFDANFVKWLDPPAESGELLY